VLIGPVAFVTSAVVMGAGAVWVPKGSASIDNIVLPIILFPAIWAVVFFYAYLDRRLLRAWAVTVVLLVVNAGVIALEFMSTGAAGGDG
jgi:hypothetical protein